jgi:crotonobetainyl-CoA:carnitine CoA-transferase CaiB-like acyl-CoA transferase
MILSDLGAEVVKIEKFGGRRPADPLQSSGDRAFTSASTTAARRAFVSTCERTREKGLLRSAEKLQTSF